MRRNTEVKYDWVLYDGDYYYTVRRITTTDDYKVFTKAEAEAAASRPVLRSST